MKLFDFKVASIAVSLVTLLGSVQAQVVISEVSATGSSASYGADWFELKNEGSTAVNIAGWKMDDNSNSLSAAVALRGVTSIAAGQSVIFLEGTASGSTDASIDSSFLAAWYGGAPSNVVFGGYGGSGVGLSSSGDSVNIFNTSGTVVARVDFGSSTTGVSFDNTAGLNNVTLTKLSAVGVNGAFMSAQGGEIGSPGVVAAVPEPQGYALALVGVGALCAFGRRSKKAQPPGGV